jgi:type II secretory pathway pseudopilin PulG
MSRRPTRAFVLLEVLVSMAILTVSVTMVMHSFTISMRATRLTRDLTIATMLGQNLIEQWEIVPPPLGESSGNFGEDHPDFSYEAEYAMEKIDYKDAGELRGDSQMADIARVSVRIYKTSKRTDSRFMILRFETALTGAEKFDPRSRLNLDTEDDDSNGDGN